MNILRAVFFPRGAVNYPCGFVTNENICISGTDGVRENCKGQSRLRKETENPFEKKCVLVKLHVNAGMRIRIGMGSKCTDTFREKSSKTSKVQNSSISCFHKVVKFSLSSLLSKVPVPSSV